MISLKDNLHALLGMFATLGSVAVQYMELIAPYLQFLALGLGIAIGIITYQKLVLEKRYFQRKLKDKDDFSNP